MNGYTLTWHAGHGAARALDGAALTPERLAGMARDELAACAVPVGRERVALGELFAIDGEPGDRLVVRDAPPLDRLGARMGGCTLEVQGPAGDDLGAGMRGGTIVVDGDAGDRVGGPAGAGETGMRDGTIRVTGDAGDFAGLRMRRGLVDVAGRCGRSPGFRMLAGTLAAARPPFDAPGLEMQRGTLLLFDDAAGSHPPPRAFRREGTFPAGELTVLRLLLRALRDGCREPPGDEDDRVILWRGDRFERNKGEIFQWLCRA